LGLLSGFFRTIGLFVVSPVEGFRRLPATGDLVRPIAFYVILGWFSEAVALLYGVALSSLNIGRMNSEFLRGLPPAVAAMLENQGAYAAASVILAPVKLVVVLLLLSAFFHVLLLVMGGGGGGFKTTVRVVCYAGTARLALLAPVCGGIASIVWAISLWIVGLAEAHRTSYGRSAVAVGVPLLCCCACVATVVFLVFAGLVSMSGLPH